jgi:hypothetical protein
MGVPYVWGGESRAEGGFDCSGFVYNVLNDTGVKVSRTTAQGYYNKFKDSPCTFQTKGALLFFGKSTNSITHVAISDGRGKMYESIGSKANTKSKPGKGVSYSNLYRRGDLVAVCDPLAKVISPFYPKYTGSAVRLDEILRTVGAPFGSVNNRKKLANINGIVNYRGSLSQNLKLIALAKSGKLVRV